MALAAEEVYNYIGAHPMFEKDKSVVYHVYAGQEHTFEDWIGRLWSAFNFMSVGRQ